MSAMPSLGVEIHYIFHLNELGMIADRSGL